MKNYKFTSTFRYEFVKLENSIIMVLGDGFTEIEC